MPRPPNPIQPGEVRNKSGRNGQSKAHDELVKVLNSPSDQVDKTWLRVVIDATVKSAQIIGVKGASDRKLLIEQAAGRARQQLDITSDGNELAGASVAVALVDAVVASALEKLHKLDDDGDGGAAPPVG